MLDIYGVNKQPNYDQQVFYGRGVSSTVFSWQTWTKPRGMTMINIMAIGAGAGGAAGVQATAPTARGGGSGGGSGAIAQITGPLILLPDNLYIQVGLGGAGGASSGTAGTSGGRTYITVRPSTAAPSIADIILTSETAPAANTTAATVATNTLGAWMGAFLFTARAGQAGSAAAASNTPFSTCITSGGAGGGSVTGANPGVSSAGGNSTANGIAPIVTGGVAGTSADAGVGNSGFFSMNPFISTGGAGGGGSNTAVGGRGGTAAYGSGGGGGGGGTTAFGAGGRGGDGIVIITCW